MNISSLIPLFLLTLSLQAHAFTDGFVENRGQWPADVRYRLQLDGLTMWITDRGAVYDLYERVEPAFAIPQFELFDAVEEGSMPRRDEPARIRGHVLRAEFVGASGRAEAIGGETMSGRVNFFIGNDESRWGRNCRIYSSVRLKDLYEGIDAVYYLDGGMPRYDLIVGPWADAAGVRMAIEGADELMIAGSGRLVIGTSLGDIDMRELITYQVNSHGERCQVASRFSLDGRCRVGFAIGPYDRSRPLVVDPLIFSTLLGGSGYEHPTGIDLDADGNVYITGNAEHVPEIVDFPIVPGAYDSTRRGSEDIFVAKLSAAGDSLLYATYVGGADLSEAGGIAVNGQGEAFITGASDPDPEEHFPTTTGAFSDTHQGFKDIYLVKLSIGGDTLLYSTLIGGGMVDQGHYIALDSSDCAYVAGTVYTIDFIGIRNPFPTTPGAFDATYNGWSDVVILKMSARGDSLHYATLIGGGGLDLPYGLGIDSSGHAYVGGYTKRGNEDTTDYPTTPGVYLRKPVTGQDGFITKLSPDGRRLIFSTLVGGPARDGVRTFALGPSGESVLGVVIDQGTDDYPVTPDAFDQTPNGWSDVAVTKLSADGRELIFSTLFGGYGDEGIEAIRIDEVGQVVIAGYAAPQSRYTFPLTPDAFDTSFNGYNDAYVAMFSADGRRLYYSSVLGGNDGDYVRQMAMDREGNIILLGTTESVEGEEAGFPLTPGAFDLRHNGVESDLFITKIALTLSAVESWAPVRSSRLDLR